MASDEEGDVSDDRVVDRVRALLDDTAVEESLLVTEEGAVPIPDLDGLDLDGLDLEDLDLPSPSEVADAPDDVHDEPTEDVGHDEPEQRSDDGIMDADVEQTPEPTPAPRKKHKPKGLFLGTRRDDGRPV
ncbi:MAG: hypothetical protein O3B05_05950, partial [archaeon]|nr:hypothetical protein [archaeon]